MIIIYVILAILVIYCLIKIIKYHLSSYAKVTHNLYVSVITSKGLYGEYMLYNRLKYMEKQGAKFLFNLYIPKSDGNTTEIDMIMISNSGLYVFENKNYAGWIYGNSKNKTWTQVLPMGRGQSQKNHFYSPVLQNQSHIQALKNLQKDDIRYISIIVFSNRCTLKKIEGNMGANVVLLSEIPSLVSIYEKNMNTLTNEKIEKLYAQLYPYSQNNMEIKAKHINEISNKVN